MRALSYALEEALLSLRRAGQSAAMSIGTIAVAFLTLGGFLLLSANLQALVDRWASAAEMSIFLKDDADAAMRETLLAETGARPGVLSVEFVSKDAARQRFKSDFPELGDVAAAAENPFPASIEVRLTPDPRSAGMADLMATELASRPGVADVRYDGRWLARITTAVTAARVGGVAIAAVLILGAAFTAASVVRLSLEARRDEIDIMQLVGAPTAFIRGPFVAEGALLGGIGAALALVVLLLIFTVWRTRIDASIAGLAVAGHGHFLGWSEGLILVGAGFLLGGLAGAIATRSVR
jgi:cell division transport system permease protein